MTAWRCRTGMLLACGFVLTLLAFSPSGSADELDDRKDRVTARIDSAEEHLDQSSAELAAEDQRLADAVSNLAAARTSLARTGGELVAAQALDRRMQVELSGAVNELSRARAALASSQASVSRGKDAMRAIVVHQHASGGSGLMAISTVLSTQDTVDLTYKLTSYESVLDAQAATLARLTASQVMQEVRESAFEQLKREVAARRAAAAANLEKTARLEARAQRTASRVESLVTLRSEARRAAAHARAEDLRQLEQLEEEKAHISGLLKQRAEQARRAAEQARKAAEEALRAAEAAAEGKAAERREPSGPKPTVRPDVPGPVATAAVSGLASPVDGYLTSPYGMRFHPVYKVWKLHDGTDFGAACGTPVRAAADGTVISMYYNSGYGNRVIVDHGLRAGVGLGTTYNHLSGFSAFVGQQVRQGDVIGYVGTTGASTGCHLHFMVFEDGATVDPMSWL